MANHTLTKQEEVTLLLAAVRRRHRQAVEARVAAHGLTSQQFWALESIHSRGPCVIGDVPSNLPMDQPTASRAVAALQARGLVSAESDPSDRRRRRLRLTRQGENLARECSNIAKRIRKATVQGFSQAELGALSSYLERVLLNLDHLDQVSPPPAILERAKELARQRT